MDLGGTWRAATADDALRRRFPEPDLGDEDWEPVTVPGHWRSHAAFAGSDGPLFFRRAFDLPLFEAGRANTRAWLDFAGIFYQGDVWLDGSYLGDTEGYFVPHSFEITGALAARSEHLLAVEVACAPATDRSAKRNLTGVFQDWDCIDPAWNPGGIWAPVQIIRTGPVRIGGLKVLCGEARPERAVLTIEAELDATDAGTVQIRTVVRPEGGSEALVEHTESETLAAGRNRVRWRVTVERPDLWWPHALGDQPLHEVVVTVCDDPAGEPSDRRQVVTGLRQIRMRNFVASVNGERLFLKGANAGPPRRELAEAAPELCRGDVDAAVAAGLDLLRLHAHIGRADIYDAADRVGLLLWQDLPLQWGYSNVRRQAVRQAREAVRLLGHHPSVALWCAHNEPFAVSSPPDAPTVRRRLTAQLLPGFNRSVLDSSVTRSLERADGSRPVVAHAGVWPHPLGGTDSHLYAGWHHGETADLARWLARFPNLARFVGEFGAQAVPDSAGWMEPERWPDLDWDRLAGEGGMATEIFDRRVPPAAHASFDGWRRATQAYQAELLRTHIELLRRLKYRPTGGFCQFMLADAQPSVSASVLDHERKPKLGYQTLKQACAPVIVVADRPAASYRVGERVRLAVHAVSDLRTPISGVRVSAVLRWGKGEQRWGFAGNLGPDTCARIGHLDATIPAGTPPGPLSLDLDLSWGGGEGEGEAGKGEGGRVSNHYDSVVVA